jgi:hypothetical protein
MIFFRIKRFHHPSSIIAGDSFPFSGSDWDKRARVQHVPDQFMDLFRIVTFVHHIEVGLSGSVALSDELFGVRNIVDRVLRDLQTGDNLLRSINGDRGFQEPFSGLTCSP